MLRATSHLDQLWSGQQNWLLGFNIRGEWSTNVLVESAHMTILYGNVSIKELSPWKKQKLGQIILFEGLLQSSLLPC